MQEVRAGETDKHWASQYWQNQTTDTQEDRNVGRGLGQHVSFLTVYIQDKKVVNQKKV